MLAAAAAGGAVGPVRGSILLSSQLLHDAIGEAEPGRRVRRHGVDVDDSVLPEDLGGDGGEVDVVAEHVLGGEVEERGDGVRCHIADRIRFSLSIPSLDRTSVHCGLEHESPFDWG